MPVVGGALSSSSRQRHLQDKLMRENARHGHGHAGRRGSTVGGGGGRRGGHDRRKSLSASGGASDGLFGAASGGPFGSSGVRGGGGGASPSGGGGPSRRLTQDGGVAPSRRDLMAGGGGFSRRLTQEGGAAPSRRDLMMMGGGRSQRNLRRDIAMHRSQRFLGLDPEKDKDSDSSLDGSGRDGFGRDGSGREGSGGSASLSSSFTDSLRHPGRFHGHMPMLMEDQSMRKFNSDSLNNLSNSASSIIGLHDSVSTNPELFLAQSHGEMGDSASSLFRRNDSEPRRRLHSEEEGESQGAQRGGESQVEATPSPDERKNAPKGSSSKTKDTFAENNPAEERGKKRPGWFNKLNDSRKWIGSVVNNGHVQNVILFLILVNALMMGVATFPSIKNDPDIISKFELVDLVFLVLFTIESGMQLIYHGYTLLRDGFLVFDVLIVVMSWALEGAQVVRAFRIFRATRLVTRVETLRNLVMALFSVFPKMTAIFMLLMLIFYIFAVMFTQLFKSLFQDQLVRQPYFDTIYFSMFTLFQMMTLDEWAIILYQIQRTYWWAWMPFVLFIIITAFVVVNLIIAVICDAVHVLGNKTGLHGYDSDSGGSRDGAPEDAEEKKSRSDEGGSNNFATTSPPINHTEIRLEELQRQLNEMVLVQDQMRITIGVLAHRLRENAGRESEPRSADPKPRISRPRTSPPRRPSGEEVPRSGTMQEKTLGESEHSKELSDSSYRTM